MGELENWIEIDEAKAKEKEKVEMSKPKPTTPEDWLHLTNLYEKAMLKDKQTIASLKEELNKVKQRLKKQSPSISEINREHEAMRITVQGVDVPVPSFVPMSLGLAPMTLESSRLSSSFGDVLIVGAEGCGDIKMIPLKDLGLQLIPRKGDTK